MTITATPASIGTPQAATTPARWVPPRVGTSLIVTAALIVSLAPSLLPRSSAAQAAVTGVVLAIAAALVSLLNNPIPESRTPRATRRTVAFASSAAISVAAMYAHYRWQNALRSAMDLEPVSWMYVAEVTAGAVCVTAIAVGLGRAVVRGSRALGRTRTLLLLVVSALLLHMVAAPAVRVLGTTVFAASAASFQDGVYAPLSTTRSGSPHSLTPWIALGREGRQFASAGTQPSTVRTYVGLDSAPTLTARVALGIREMERAGAFDRSTIVVAVPTGSGWLDENAIAGAEEQYGGDVATIALQYSTLPSWATFLFAENDARESADALVRAVTARAAAHHRAPHVVLYGQSLGSVAGSAVYTANSAGSTAVCGALWAGPPAGAVDTTNAVVLANSSDPVVWWSTRLLLERPDLSRARIDAPLPQWIPVVSFLQTSVDLLSALSFGAGHGHSYGREQGRELPSCT